MRHLVAVMDGRERLEPKRETSKFADLLDIDLARFKMQSPRIVDLYIRPDVVGQFQAARERLRVQQV